MRRHGTISTLRSERKLSSARSAPSSKRLVTSSAHHQIPLIRGEADQPEPTGQAIPDSPRLRQLAAEAPLEVVARGSIARTARASAVSTTALARLPGFG